MNKIFTLMIVLITLTISVSGQPDTLYQSNHKFNVVRTYTGQRFTELFSTDSLSIDNLMTTRIGLSASWTPTKLFKVTAIPFGEYGNKKNWVNAFVSARFGTNSLNIQTGYMPTISATFRPYPWSISGQFEYMSTSVIPGGAFGSMISAKTGDLVFALGIAERGIQFGDSIETSIKVGYKNFSVAGVLSIENQNSAIIIQWKGKIVNTTAYFTENIVSASMDITLHNGLMFVGDVVLLHTKFKSFQDNYLEFAIGKTVSATVFQKETTSIFAIGLFKNIDYDPGIAIYVAISF